MKKTLLYVAAGLIMLSAEARADETIVPRFDIQRIFLEGNTILPSETVAAILKKYTGSQKDFGTLQQAMDDIEAAIRRRGYTMATVILPEQELERGTVIITVIEPRIRDILVEGNRYFSRENILQALPTLKTGESPNVAAISENLRAANENPARKLALQFKSGEKDTELTAQVKVTDQKPWRLTLTGDNSGSGSTGRYRTGLGFQYFNMFNRDHMLALQYTTSPDEHFDKVQVVSGSYRIPLYRWGDTIDLFGAYSDVDSGTTQVAGENIKVSGKGVVSGLRYTVNLLRSGAYEQKLIGGMDYRLYDNSVLLSNADVAKDVVAHPFSLTYGGTWATDPVTFDASAGLVYNIPWGGQGLKSDFRAVRSEATANYLIARYGLNLLGRPGADWMLRLALNGQYTPDRLIPGEQFGLGGSTSVRGYEEREESWDAGINGSAEVYSPDLARLAGTSLAQLRLVGFYDSGYGYNLRPQSGELKDHSLGGAGTGIRFSVGEYVNFSLDWGHALKDSVNTRKNTSRIHFRASLSY